jgi:hypothetical protein
MVTAWPWETIYPKWASLTCCSRGHSASTWFPGPGLYHISFPQHHQQTPLCHDEHNTNHPQPSVRDALKVSPLGAAFPLFFCSSLLATSRLAVKSASRSPRLLRHRLGPSNIVPVHA